MLKRTMLLAAVACVVVSLGSGAMGDVFNMGAGLTSLEWVTVGNPGNAGELSGAGAGGYGPDRICGAVDYAYRIGKYEVTAGQYTEFLNAVDPSGPDPHDLYNSSMGSGLGGITFTPGNPDGSKYEVRPGRGNMPVNYVSFWDACRFANWLHNGQSSGDTETGAYTLTADGISNNTVMRNPDWKWAITSEDEWYKAAYHKNDGATGNYWDYPTGSDTAPTAETPVGTDFTNGSANYDLAVGDLTDVGAYTAKPSDSPYGTFDQGGNVFEWNEAIISTLNRGCLGGCFYHYDSYMLASSRLYSDPTYEYDDFGFRVAEVPEPACASVLFLGALALLRRRASGFGG